MKPQSRILPSVEAQLPQLADVVHTIAGALRDTASSAVAPFAGVSSAAV